jgi:WD40 repeat protein
MRRVLIVLVWITLLTSLTSAQTERSVILPTNGQLVTEVGVLSVMDSLNDAAFSPDSRFVATVGDDTALRVWDVTTGKQVDEAFEHFSFIKSLIWVGDNIVTGSWDKTAIVWDVADGVPSVRETISDYDAVIDALGAPKESPLMTVFIGVGDGKIRAYDLVNKSVNQEWPVSALRVTTIAVSPDAQTVVTGAGYPATGAQWWSMVAQETAPLGAIPYVGTVFTAVYLTENLVAVGGDDGTVIIWDIATGEQIASLEQSDWVIDLAVSPDGTILGVARQDGVLTLWDVTSPDQSELIVAIVASDSAALTSVDFSPDGRLIVTTDEEGTARLWGIEVK